MSDRNTGAAGGGAIYALGIFGAWVWFWQQADAFWDYVLAIVQGLLWPAGWSTTSSRPSPAERSGRTATRTAGANQSLVTKV